MSLYSRAIYLYDGGIELVTRLGQTCPHLRGVILRMSQFLRGDGSVPQVAPRNGCGPGSSGSALMPAELGITSGLPSGERKP